MKKGRKPSSKLVLYDVIVYWREYKAKYRLDRNDHGWALVAHWMAANGDGRVTVHKIPLKHQRRDVAPQALIEATGAVLPPGLPREFTLSNEGYDLPWFAWARDFREAHTPIPNASEAEAEASYEHAEWIWKRWSYLRRFGNAVRLTDGFRSVMNPPDVIADVRA